jgi:Sigma-70, region 4
MKLIEAIRTLPLEQRVMIGAVWFKGLSVADIADQFDVSEQYVKALLHYGLRSLKSAVDEDSERARSPVRHVRRRQRITYDARAGVHNCGTRIRRCIPMKSVDRIEARHK